MILADSGRHTAIIISKGTQAIRCVRMDAGELTIAHLHPAQIEAEGWLPHDYPLDRAIDIYLAHPAGISPAARQALEGVALAALLG